MTDHIASRIGGRPAQIKERSFVRPLAFGEALKFTPMTTSPLHPSDQIPLPAVEPAGHRVSLTSQSDKKAVAGIKITPDVQNELRHLLRPKDLSEFKFKKRPSTSKSASQPLNLGSLARHVYSGPSLDYQYSSEPGTPADQRTPSAPVTNQTNSAAYNRNSSIVTPSTTQSKSTPQSLVVNIQQPEGFRREDYAAVPDSPKRRKLQHSEREAQLALRQRTQKEQGDAAVLQFQNKLVNILETRDRIEEDDSNDPAVFSGSGFEPAEDDDDDFRMQFTTSELAKLQTQLKDLSRLKRLDDISNDHIDQLRQLCEGPVRKAQTLNLRLSQDPSTEDVEVWQSRIRSAETGAASASVILLTALAENGPNLSPDLLLAIRVVLENVFESCLIPVIEARPDGQSGTLFTFASSNAANLRRLLETFKKLLDQLATACVQFKEAAECLHATEFLAARLIFVQNGATDKVAALGVKTYERTRKQVMSYLARLFVAFPADRPPIMDEILSSVDKLPSTSRSARQYSLGDGKSIMLVTALFVQLVHSSALGENRKKGSQSARYKKPLTDDDDDDDDDDASAEEEEDEDSVAGDDDELSRLRTKAEQLLNPALKTSGEIVRYLVGKASKVTKTGDSPYRNILDLFVEDLLTLLPLPDWPAAQVVLETFYQKMTGLVQHEKTAGVKNMALESLGTMGAAIASAKASAQAHATAISRESADGSDVAHSLSRLANDHFARGLSKEELLGPDGPFALTCRYYNLQDGNKESKGLRALSAQSFYLAQYASWYCRHMIPEPGEEITDSIRSGAMDLLDEINGVASETPSYAFLSGIHPREAVLAYLLSTLASTFCRRYETIAQTLLASLSSDQAQVRSRSLKSIQTMLETDSSLLEVQSMRIEQYIFPCASDDSAMVRDSALNLIAKFLISKPAYEERGIRKLIQCTRDGKVGVQKRSIVHLAEVYAQDERPALKAKIAETILRRTADVEESVSELAKRTLADAWFTPRLALAEEAMDSAKASVAIEELTLHLAITLEHSLDELPHVLTKFISGQLKLSKTSAQLGALLNRIVSILFNTIVGGKAKPSSLQLLVCLAQARPETIAPTQLSHLRQYITHISTGEDLMMFKAVIGIFHHVLPRLSITHQDLLTNIQSDLFSAVTKMALRSDLDSVMSCLRTIVDVIESGARFVKLLKSIIDKLGNAAVNDASRKRLLFIVGSLAKYIDVDSLPTQGYIDISAAGSVSGTIADLILPFAARTESDDLQETALESLGCVCQAWPGQFEKRKIRNLFLQCLELSADSKARSTALRTFEELFARWGDDSDEEDDAKDKDKIEPVQDLKKMGGNAKVQSDNSALAGIAPPVFDRVKKIALSTSGAELVLAARTVASMTKRGTFHPHDYADVYLALETSEVLEVRSILEQAHSKAHTKNETRWAGEYMLAVKKAFKYQLHTAEDPSGCRQGVAKLSTCFTIINTSGSKYVRQFLSSLIRRLFFDRSKVDTTQKIPIYVLFVRFVVQNLAFFEYTRMEDLLHAIQQLELVFGKNGAEVSETIETSLSIDLSPAENNSPEAKDKSLENGTEPMNDGVAGEAPVPGPPAPAPAPEPAPAPVQAEDSDLLRRVAAAACAITMVSEARSHLKRQYGITRDAGAILAQSKQTNSAAKAPTKVHGFTGERFLNNTNSILLSMETEDSMRNRCREFYKLMDVDEDVVVGEEGDGLLDEHSVSMDADGDMLAPLSRGKKRKSTGSTGGTPRKRGRPRKNATPTRRSSSASSRDHPDADFMG